MVLACCSRNFLISTLLSLRCLRFSDVVCCIRFDNSFISSTAAAEVKAEEPAKESVVETPEVTPAAATPAPVEESPAVATTEVSKDVKIDTPEAPVEKEAVPETGKYIWLHSKMEHEGSAVSIQGIGNL